MLKTIVLSVLLALAVNACVIDINDSWAYYYTDKVVDSATTNAPLNINYNCFDACPETSITMIKFKVSLEHRNESRVSFNEFELDSSKPDFDTNELTCIDPNLRSSIQRSLDKLTSYSAKAIATNLQYNLNVPGWAINVVKTEIYEGGLNNYYANRNFCKYVTTIQGITTDIIMGLVDTQA